MDADKHSAKYLYVRGREEILVDPCKEDFVSDYDEVFFNRVVEGDTVCNEFSFILDRIVSSVHMVNLNIFLCDTVVLKKGSPHYFIFNDDKKVLVD